MNKTFKTLWNDVRRCFIVANEAQKSHGKPSKSAVVAVAVAAALGATAASAAYVERGFVASSSGNLADAVDSWETKEYKSDWGLKALNASTAYALGYHGQGVAVGVMDSGAYLYHHPDLNGDRSTPRKLMITMVQAVSVTLRRSKVLRVTTRLAKARLVTAPSTVTGFRARTTVTVHM